MKPPEIRREESATATCPLPWARVADQAWGNVIGGPCWYHEEVASTNTKARSLAKAGAPEGAVVIAESQTSGRGRRGRSWFCPAGKGLLISVLLRPTLPVSQVHLLTLVAACAAAEAIEATVDLPVGIKWPNDLFLGDRKAGGILVEAAGAGAAVDWVVAGIGINVNTEPGELPARGVPKRHVDQAGLRRGRGPDRASDAPPGATRRAVHGGARVWVRRRARRIPRAATT